MSSDPFPKIYVPYMHVLGEANNTPWERGLHLGWPGNLLTSGKPELHLHVVRELMKNDMSHDGLTYTGIENTISL